MAYADLVAAADRAGQKLLGGETVTYTPSNGSPVPVTGIFDAQFVLAQGNGDHAGVEVTAPAVFFRLEDLPTDPEADVPTLTIRGAQYSVIEHKPDGVGGIVLVVRRIT